MSKKGVTWPLWVLFIVCLALSGFSWIFIFMIVGAGVSGSGCGAECLGTVEKFQIVSVIFLIAAFVSALAAFVKRNTLGV